MFRGIASVVGVMFLSTLLPAQWEYVVPFTDSRIRVQDALVLEQGMQLLVNHFVSYEDADMRADLHVLDPDGWPQEIVPIWTDTVGVLSTVTLHDGERTWTIGVLQDDMGQWALQAVVFNEANAVVSRFVYPVQGIEFMTVDNAARVSTGEFVIAAGARNVGDLGTRTAILMRLGMDGALLAENQIEGPVLLLPRDIIELNDGSLLMSCAGGAYFVQGAGVSYKVDVSSLELLSGIVPQPYHGNSGGSLSSLDYVHEHQSVIELPSGDFLIGGRVGNLWPDSEKAVAYRITGSGAPITHFISPSSYYHDHPAHLTCMATASDGNVLFAMMANYQPGPPSPFSPTQPNRVDVFKLDTALNLLCRYEVDGFEDQYYYFVDRIKATPDGGFILVGGRSDLTQPVGNFSGWVRKFSAEDCVTSVAEHPDVVEAILYPNPGVEGFTVLLNGPVVQGARLQLWDGMGRHVLEAQLFHGRATVDAARLASGLYPYAIMDGQGRRLATGRWVKE